MEKTNKSDLSKEEVWVTQKMLYHVRDELKADIQGLKSGQESLRKGQESLRKELREELREELRQIFEQLTSVMDSRFHQLAGLIEEQNARNVVVLDGLNFLFHRQDRLEGEWVEFKRELNK